MRDMRTYKLLQKIILHKKINYLTNENNINTL